MGAVAGRVQPVRRPGRRPGGGRGGHLDRPGLGADDRRACDLAQHLVLGDHDQHHDPGGAALAGRLPGQGRPRVRRHQRHPHRPQRR
jgi:hypothetical protein